MLRDQPVLSGFSYCISYRWRPVFPLGVPHASTADNEYEDGRYVPAGTTLIANIEYGLLIFVTPLAN